MARHSLAEVATGAAVLLLAAGFLGYALTNTGHTKAPGYELYARFDDVGGLAAGADVRMAGVMIGRVTDVHLDPKSYQAVVGFSVDRDVKLSSDASAVISSSSLLGGSNLSIQQGGADDTLKDGQTMTVTQSAVNVEDLLGKFIFNVGALANATQKQLKVDQDRNQAPKPAGP